MLECKSYDTTIINSCFCRIQVQVPTVRITNEQTDMIAGPSRSELLMLYRRLLRAAATFPSKKRTSIYQAIRDEWRDDAKLNPTDHEEKIQERITVAYKGLSQLRQYDVMTMTKGNISSPNWSVTLEQNPMPKPDNYDEKKLAR
jgi:Complex 1 protein (LYR family)